MQRGGRKTKEKSLLCTDQHCTKLSIYQLFSTNLHNFKITFHFVIQFSSFFNLFEMSLVIRRHYELLMTEWARQVKTE